MNTSMTDTDRCSDRFVSQPQVFWLFNIFKNVQLSKVTKIKSTVSNFAQLFKCHICRSIVSNYCTNANQEKNHFGSEILELSGLAHVQVDIIFSSQLAGNTHFSH